MIHYQRIYSQEDILFPFCWELYQSAFPEVERREESYHLETMELKPFRAEVIFDDDVAIGILFWWELTHFRYIEHFATSPQQRGKGYGKEALKEFISRSDKPILLEVEHPEDKLSRRRIGFYERIGFKLNHHPYSHPSYHQRPDEVVSLMIMSYPTPISAAQLQEFITEELPLIHFRSF